MVTGAWWQAGGQRGRGNQCQAHGLTGSWLLPGRCGWGDHQREANVQHWGDLGSGWGLLPPSSAPCRPHKGPRPLPPQPRGSNAPEMAQGKGSPREAHTQGPLPRLALGKLLGNPRINLIKAWEA